MGAPVVRAASHEGVTASDRVTWKTDVVLGGSATRGDVIPFAHTLPLSAHVVDTPSLGVWRDATGAIAGLSVERELSRRVAFEVVAPRDGKLVAPLLESDAVQRVTLSGNDEPRFEADARMIRHVGWLATDSVDAHARGDCDAALGGEAPPLAIYVRATGTLASEGLRGELSTHASRTRTPALAVTLVLVALVAALVLLARKLRRDARVEEAEAELEDAFRRMDESP